VNDQQWTFETLWKKRRRKALSRPLGLIPPMSPGEQALSKSFFEADLLRQGDTFGVGIKAYGLAKVNDSRVVGIRVGDLVVAVDGRPAADGQDVHRLLEGKDYVHLKLRRHGSPRRRRRWKSAPHGINSDIVHKVPGLSASAWDPLLASLQSSIEKCTA